VVASKRSQPEFTTKGETVQRLIRQAIASGQIQAGDRLLQNELAERLGVSPTPVREALQALVAQGVLAHVPNKGVRVIELDYRAAEEVYRIRAALEPLAIEIGAPRLAPDDLDEMAGVLASMTRAARDRRIDRVKALDHRFHFLIYSAAGPGRLLDQIERLWTLHVEDTFRLDPDRFDVSMDHHAAILQALEEGRFADVGILTKEHIESAARIVLEHMSPDLNLDGRAGH
jgi:DNA-binding GntR family transcriptional regulator